MDMDIDNTTIMAPTGTPDETLFFAAEIFLNENFSSGVRNINFENFFSALSILFSALR